MSDLDPGPGWREVTYEQWRSDDVPVNEDTAYIRVGSEEHFYWREVPVPALPTAPYTVIRVTWKNNEFSPRVLTFIDGEWTGQNRSVRVFATGQQLATDTTGFEVLSEPRAVTAKAVLARVRKLHHSAGDLSIPARFSDELDHIAREFGVPQ